MSAPSVEEIVARWESAPFDEEQHAELAVLIASWRAQKAALEDLKKRSSIDNDHIEVVEDELARTKDRVTKLKEALEPFAEMELWTDAYPDGPLHATRRERIVEPEWVVAARAALNPQPAPKV